MRECRVCHRRKSLNCSNFEPVYWSGRAYFRRVCKPCHSRERWDYQQEWCRENPSLVYAKKWRHRQTERYRKTQIAYRERQAENSRRYRQTPYGREMIAMRQALRRGALAGAAICRRDVWLRDGRCCRLCKKPVRLKRMHLDHIVPIALGGTHTYDNVQATHQFCNQSKGDSCA